MQWATEPHDAQPAQWAGRLSMVRGFARYAHGVDPRHEVPPPGLLPERYRRRQPYLYRDTEIAELIAAARELSATTGLRPLTYATMLGLLSVTGMRVSEVVNLDRDDVDLASGVLTVRESKFGKSRYLPVHESTTRALCRYNSRRPWPRSRNSSVSAHSILTGNGDGAPSSPGTGPTSNRQGAPAWSTAYRCRARARSFPRSGAPVRHSGFYALSTPAIRRPSKHRSSGAIARMSAKGKRPK